MSVGPLLHRGRELAVLDDVLTAVSAGNPAVVVVQGPRGIGKTALLQAALARVPGQSLVLRARCHDNERDFPYSVVRQLFDPLLTGSGRTEEVPAEPVARLDPRVEPTSAEGYDLLQGLFQVTRSLSATRPVVIAIDDLTFADAASLTWFSYIARRLDGLPVALLVTVDSDTDDRLLTELGTLTYSHLLHPGPLCDSCAEHRVAAAFGAPLDIELAAACHTLSLGNPLVLRELTSRLLNASVSPGAPDLETVLELGAATLSDTTLEWLHTRHPAAVDLLTNLAILGPDADLTTAAALAGQGEFQAGEARAALCRSGLIDPGPPHRFRHELMRTAILSRIGSAARLDLHARAAVLLARLGAPAAQTAEHLMSLGPTGHSWALPILRTAAREAAASRAWDTAARYLRRALSESADPATTLALTSELGSVELHRDVAACARYAVTVAAAHPEPLDRARALLPLAHPVLVADSAAGARTFVETVTALESVGAVPRTLLLQLGAQTLLAGHRCGAFRALRSLRKDDGEAPVGAFLGALAALTAAGGRFPDRAGRLAERCVALSSPAVAGAEVLGAALAFAWTGRPADAAVWAERAVLGARARSHPGEQVLSLLVRADIAHRRQRWAVSLSDSREALRLAEQVGAPGLAAGAAAGAARALVMRQQPDAAAALLAATTVPSDVHPLVGAAVLEARGLIEAARGEHTEALRWFLECGHQLAARGIANPACVPWRSHAAASYQALGESAAARTIASEGNTAGRVRPPAPAGSARRTKHTEGERRTKLTAGERRVTDLVLTGLSNLEVAEQLCLSKRTVDTHLGRIYRKLGIRGRPELAAALEQAGDLG